MAKTPEERIADIEQRVMRLEDRKDDKVYNPIFERKLLELQGVHSIVSEQMGMLNLLVVRVDQLRELVKRKTGEDIETSEREDVLAKTVDSRMKRTSDGRMKGLMGSLSSHYMEWWRKKR